MTEVLSLRDAAMQAYEQRLRKEEEDRERRRLREEQTARERREEAAEPLLHTLKLVLGDGPWKIIEAVASGPTWGVFQNADETVPLIYVSKSDMHGVLCYVAIERAVKGPNRWAPGRAIKNLADLGEWLLNTERAMTSDEMHRPQGNTD